MELPYRLELMFLNAGKIFLMHLSTHTSTISFQSEINGEIDNVDFAIEAGRTVLAAHLVNLVMYHYSSHV